MPDNRRSSHWMLAAVAMAAAAFLLVSLLSFDVRDWPNPDVAPGTVEHNLCGPLGAFVAYYCHYYLGPAGIVLLVGVVAWLVLQLLRRQVDQIALRGIGLFLVGAVAAAGSYLFHHATGLEGTVTNALSHGHGGVLGIAIGHFLLQKMALTGTLLALAAALLVGMLLAADELLFMLPKVVWQGVSRLTGGLGGLATAGAGVRIFKPRAAKDATTLGFPQPNDAAVAVAEEAAEDAEEEYEEEDEEEADEDEAEEEDAEAVFDDNEDGIAESAQRAEDKAKAREMSLTNVGAALAKMRGMLPAAPPTAPANEFFPGYEYPPFDLLEDPEVGFTAVQSKVVKAKGDILQKTIDDFNINARVVSYDTGPVITLYELQLAPGIKVSQITNLANDLARSLGAAAVRVVAPMPGKNTIGIEVPNSEKEKVRLKELFSLATKKVAKMNIPLFLGKDASGEPLIVDLTSMPHCLIAGTTGSGKSVCLNTIIMSVLMTQRPDMVKLILVDPKMVEMNSFRDAPHLMCPIVTEMRKAEQILEWLTTKMDERYALLAEARVRNVESYNKLGADEIYARFCPSNEDERAQIPTRLPYMVIVIDELADLMMTSAKEVESDIIRLAQKSRAVGIHIVLATQRPQATVVTGLIKSNLPTRISFRVSARMDSRIVLDQNGAEALLGHGDMLYLQPGTSELRRAQGTFLSDEEIHKVMDFLRDMAQPRFNPELIQLNTADVSDMEKDELFDEAVKIVLETGRGSVSLLQRRLTIGYSRASRLIDQMGLAGIVGEYKGSQAREVLITPQEYEVIRRQMMQDAAAGFSDLAEDDDDGPAVAPPVVAAGEQVAPPTSSETAPLRRDFSAVAKDDQDGAATDGSGDAEEPPSVPANIDDEAVIRDEADDALESALAAEQAEPALPAVTVDKDDDDDALENTPSLPPAGAAAALEEQAADIEDAAEEDADDAPVAQDDEDEEEWEEEEDGEEEEQEDDEEEYDEDELDEEDEEDGEDDEEDDDLPFGADEDDDDDEYEEDDDDEYEEDDEEEDELEDEEDEEEEEDHRA